MEITETRIDLAAFTCPGCDCGECVTGALRDIGEVSGVDHVRVDRRRTQIVVRHVPDDVSPGQLRDIVEERGLEVRS
jgi:copper chaperone CopZ